MNRTIRFRMFDKGQNRMLQWDEVKTSLMQVLEFASAPIMQYAGMKDKNGVEIYEGDIVRLGDEEKRLLSPPDYPEAVRQECLVGMRCGSWMFARHSHAPTEPDTYLWMWVERLEVIGNIHEHPELLEAK